ncbi:UDP-N-acetylmuramoyl-tripeptide--D-alanyl-D-alanine ligase [Sporosarcina limicola]|uniref:UDP-N-acetylmuramoyl-tripeptide--D-alanyl-D-alanine ligase n=1 Tax=Sporosarcina limicola TaxID=34101 RepID=A0A927R4A2_9BACL|nr:UDP-N-acetylmuramoyl-tripeptide--D-alanyl-D-alanine ligase [Sporosarcina limicola]MBE1555961.1 UDP-N-acetylmuramoyl-tripeptide--D-alanyl-D-alanine ligase [Sporosarcina limicola]
MIKRALTNVTDMLHDSYLKGHNVVIHGVSIDSRAISKGNLFIPLIGPNSNGHHYSKSAIDNGAVASLWNKNEPNPPTDIPLIFVEDTLAALQQLAGSYRQQLQQTTFIGITGSNGKTSTKDILHSILSTSFRTQKTQGNFNNEIGVPLTLLQLYEDVEIVVVEMGMDHKGDIAFLSKMVQPDIAIISNIGNAHLISLGSLENIAEEKVNIVRGLKKDGLLLFNGDLPLVTTKVKKHKYKHYSFGIHESNDLFLTSCRQTSTSVLFTISDNHFEFNLPLIGQHQAINCLPAIMIAKILKMSNELIQVGLSEVELTEQRNEVKKIGNITIINDTYKSNPESVQAALDTLGSLTSSHRKLFIMGDMLDMGDQDIKLHKQVGEYLSHKKIDTVYGYGELTRYTIASAKQNFPQGKAILFTEEARLIDAILDYTKEPCILLFKASRTLQFERLVKVIERRITR